MDGYPLWEFCPFQRDHRKDEDNLRYTWLARDCGV